MSERARTISIWDPGIVRQAIVDSFRKLDPRIQIKNPVMFIVEVGSLLTTIVFVQELAAGTGRPLFTGQVAFWLWFTVLFANFAEAMAEGRGKAQADTLRKTRTETVANRLTAGGQHRDGAGGEPAQGRRRHACDAGEFIPGDGEIIEGVASVDESAITGESAPVIRESGGDRSAVTGGTRVHFGLDQGPRHVRSRPHVPRSDDRARRGRGAAEDAERDRAQHPAGGADAGLPARRRDAAAVCVLRRHRDPDSGADRAARLPDSDDDRRADLGDRHRRHGSPGAAQRAGDVGPRGRSGRRRATRCCSTRPARSRSATGRRPSSCRCPASPRPSWPTRRSWRRSPTKRPRGARSSCWPRRSTASAGRELADKDAVFVPFTAQTRMSGINLDGREIRKGAADAIAAYVKAQRRRRVAGAAGASSSASRAPAARRSSSPSATRALGVVHLKDIVKGGMRQRFDALRAMGIKTVMITGDNPLTAAVDRQRSRRRRLPGRRRRPRTRWRSSGASRPRASSWR